MSITNVTQTSNVINNIGTIGSLMPVDIGEATEAIVNLSFDINRFFAEYNREETPINTYYPILQRRMIGGLDDVIISGRAWTDCDVSSAKSAVHGYSLIQVGKLSEGVANALGGYGIAWKPLDARGGTGSEYTVTDIKKTGVGMYRVITSENINSTSFPDNAAYIKVPYRETSGYVFVPLQVVGIIDSNGEHGFECLGGNSELIEAVIQAMNYVHIRVYAVKPNVYVVDYGAVINDINIWDNVSDEMGFLSFLSCGVADIKPNREFEFSLSISSNSGLVFSINEETIVTASTRIPMYNYIDGNKADSIGISVYGTETHKWYYDDISISNAREQYPYLYCVFSTEYLRDKVYIRATGRGIRSGDGESGIKMYVANNTGEWKQVGYSDSDDMESISSDVIVRDAYTYRGSINVLLVGEHPGGAISNSLIEVDDIRVDNSEGISFPLSGFVDAYIETDCVEDALTIRPNSSGLITINNKDYGIVHIISVSAYGSMLTRDIDYKIVYDEYSYTCQGKIAIKTALADTDAVVIGVVISPELVKIQDSIDAKKLNPLGYNLLVRHKHVHYLDVIAVNRDEILPYLHDYVSSLESVQKTKDLTYNGFVNFLERKGVHTDYVIIVDRYTDGSGNGTNYLNSPGDVIQINEVSCFKVTNE